MTKTRTGTAGLTKAVIGGAPLGAVAAAQLGAAVGPVGMAAVLLATVAAGVGTVAKLRPKSTRQAARAAARRTQQTTATQRRTTGARLTGLLGGGTRRAAGHNSTKPGSKATGSKSTGSKFGGSKAAAGTKKRHAAHLGSPTGSSKTATKANRSGHKHGGHTPGHKSRGGALGRLAGTHSNRKSNKATTPGSRSGGHGSKNRPGSRSNSYGKSSGKGLLGRLRGGGKNTTGSTSRRSGKATPEAKKTRKAIKQARKETRKRESRRRREAARVISRNKRFEWKRRIARLGLLQKMWNAGYWAGNKTAAATFVAWYWTCLAGHQLGNRVRAVHFDLTSALRAPFVGVFADWQRFQQLRDNRLAREARRVTGNTNAKTNTPAGFGGTYQEATQPMIRTNVRKMIEALEEVERVDSGRDEMHAMVAEQWHKDVAELYEVAARVLGLDAEIIHETVAMEPAAAEITASIPDGFQSGADHIVEAVNAWGRANGTKHDRLYSTDVRERAWDISNAPTE